MNTKNTYLLIGLTCSIISIAGIWYYYGFKLILFIFLFVMACRIEDKQI